MININDSLNIQGPKPGDSKMFIGDEQHMDYKKKEDIPIELRFKGMVVFETINGISKIYYLKGGVENINFTEIPIEQIKTGAGLNTDGTYKQDPTTNYIQAATSIDDASKKLDTELETVDGRVTTNETNIANHETRVTTNEANIANHETRITNNESDITDLQQSQPVGYQVYKNKTQDTNNPTDDYLPTTGTLHVSYKVSNDWQASTNNGYYHWDGSAYVKDAEIELDNGILGSDLDANGKKVKNLADGVDDQDSINLRQSQILTHQKWVAKSNTALTAKALQVINAIEALELNVASGYESHEYLFRMLCSTAESLGSNYNFKLQIRDNTDAIWITAQGTGAENIELLESETANYNLKALVNWSKLPDTFQFWNDGNFEVTINISSSLINEIKTRADENTLEATTRVAEDLVFKKDIKLDFNYAPDDVALIGTTFTADTVLRSGGTTGEYTNYSISDYIPIDANKTYFFKAGSIMANTFVLLAAYDNSKALLWDLLGGNLTMKDKYIAIRFPSSVSFVRFTKKTSSLDSGIYQSDTYKGANEVIDEVKAEIQTITNSKWKGKKIAWFGTSIPAGGGKYPSKVATKLGCTVYNMASGGSHTKAPDAGTTNYSGTYHAAISPLSETLTEKQNIIDNYATIYPNLTDSSPFPNVDDMANNTPGTAWSGYAWSDGYPQNEVKFWSYERCIIQQFINATADPTFYKGPADLIVLDHGYNDDPQQTELDNAILLNTRDNTQPGYAATLAASRDRLTFFTAMNKILDGIFEANPYQKVALIGHYTMYSPSREQALVKTQIELAKFWGIPICLVHEKAGISDQIAIGSQPLWAQTPWSDYSAGQNTANDMTILNVWIPDRVHPHSDPDKKLDTIISEIISEWLNTI